VILNQMPPWLAWLRYISPLYWLVLGVSSSEFSSSRYAGASSPAPGAPSLGAAYCAAFAYPCSGVNIGMAPLFLAGLWAPHCIQQAEAAARALASGALVNTPGR
jgi:hypothetical protein